MIAWPTTTVSATVAQPIYAWEPPLAGDEQPGYPYPLIDRRESHAVDLAALDLGGQLVLPELGGLLAETVVTPGAGDGPLLAIVEEGQPVLWRLDPATGLTVRDSGWPRRRRLVHNPTARPVSLPDWLGLPPLSLAPDETWPGSTDSAWRSPALVAEQALRGDIDGPLPGSYALAGTAALLATGRNDEATALLALPLSEAPGIPPGLLPFVRAFVAGSEPPWRWELAWGAGFAHGRLARLALEYAVECHDDVLAHYHLGCVLANWGRWDQACVHWAAATDGPDAAEANRNLGFAARRHYRDDRAAAAFYREALAIGAGAITHREAAELGVTG
ncbi:MAG: hypothetical protein HZB16_01135 [Armatimonadetes bacterium]|nr:hypothetical protein [Armatimonadota bacterium]